MIVLNSKSLSTNSSDVVFTTTILETEPQFIQHIMVQYADTVLEIMDHVGSGNIGCTRCKD